MEKFNQGGLMNIKYITGYAGTGKSHDLVELTKALDPATSVILAPTHKALKRLEGKTNPLILAQTIHAFLGWRPGINENAEELGHIDVTIKKVKPVEGLTTVVIDEAGMMSEDMLFSIVERFEELYDYETDCITMWLFLDPYQLPPVKGRQIQVDPTHQENRTIQYRAESPDLVALFTKFVHYIEHSNHNDLTTPLSENVLGAKAFKNFKVGDRCLAYTNEAVGKHNQTIAKLLGITSYINQEVQIGNLTETHKIDEILNPNEKYLTNIYHTGELYMQDMNINKNFLSNSICALINHPQISFIRVGCYIMPVIFGTHNAHVARKKAREKAIGDCKYFADVYALGRAFTCDYTFASTVHKSQGSEFDMVWIDKQDILKSSMNNNYRQYARMMYVALSRAKKTVVIYGS